MTAMTVGMVAGTLTSIAAIPQLARTLRTRHVRDISIWQPLRHGRGALDLIRFSYQGSAAGSGQYHSANLQYLAFDSENNLPG